MKRKVLAGLLSAAMVATTVFGSVGVWAAEDAAEETTEETAEDPSDDAAADEDSDTAKINPEGKNIKSRLATLIWETTGDSRWKLSQNMLHPRNHMQADVNLPS
jgi:hypothetical protein